jgi:hypothetical protein
LSLKYCLNIIQNSFSIFEKLNLRPKLYSDQAILSFILAERKCAKHLKKLFVPAISDFCVLDILLDRHDKEKATSRFEFQAIYIAAN